MPVCSKSEVILLSCLLFLFLGIPSFAEVEFERHEIMTEPITINYVDYVDMDNDMDLDIVAVYSRVILCWFENTGDGNYQEHNIDRHDRNNILNVVDLDNDNDMDIVIIQANNIYVYINDSNQNFTRQFIAGTNSTIHSFCITDLDEDGGQDIVSGQSDDFVFWLENMSTDHMAFRQHIIVFLEKIV